MVVIIAVLTGLATLALGGNQQRQLQQEAQRLQQVLQLLRDEAELRQVELGLRFTADGYEVVQLDPVALRWQLLQEAPFTPYHFPLPIQVDLQLEGNRFTATATQHDSLLSGAGQSGAGTSTSMQPQLMFLSSGENSAFALSLYLNNSRIDSNTTAVWLQCDGFGPLTLSQQAVTP